MKTDVYVHIHVFVISPIRCRSRTIWPIFTNSTHFMENIQCKNVLFDMHNSYQTFLSYDKDEFLNFIHRKWARNYFFINLYVRAKVVVFEDLPSQLRLDQADQTCWRNLKIIHEFVKMINLLVLFRYCMVVIQWIGISLAADHCRSGTMWFQ